VDPVDMGRSPVTPGPDGPAEYNYRDAISLYTYEYRDAQSQERANDDRVGGSACVGRIIA
jgi:hypothetical protein